MNSPTELHERLLKLFPVKIVKAQFEVEGNTQAEMLPEIAAKYSVQAIRDFAIDKIGMTRQHSHVFTLSSKFIRKIFNPRDLPFEVISELHDDRGNYVFVGLPIVEFQVALTNPMQEFQVDFYQPTRIVVQGRQMVIQTTIMERSASAYVPLEKDRKLLDIAKRNTEDVFIADILSVFRKHYTVEVCDLNKGVKAVWEKNLIDCTSVKYRKDKSFTTEAMDEKYTVKAHMPEEYQNIIKRPLSKTLFRPQRADDKFSRNFSVDPSKGVLSMATYPEDPDQTWNVINEILANN